MPSEALNGFRDWIEDIETDYPIMINAEFVERIGPPWEIK